MAKVLARGPEVAREPVFGGPRARFWWPAEGFPNVKGCGPRERATEVFFFKVKKLKKIEKIEN